MLGLLRTAVSLLFLSLVVWCSFTVPLGRRTLAEHVDRIGKTREATELIQGARARINPILDEAKNRLLGEYVEAPTYLPSGEPAPARTLARPRPRGDVTPARTLPSATTRDGSATRPSSGSDRSPSTADGARLPGRRARSTSAE
ncbi:MAG: hypothetical protein H6711_28605 [Myxococcales bacterium]|nr:hypothetical protein [Myxococcales bacterium]